MTACLLLLVQAAYADWTVKVSVVVNSTKSDGDAWDMSGGAPDIAICIVTPSNTHCDPADHGTAQDKFRATFANVIVPNGPFTVWVYDVDMAANDNVGAAACKGKGDQWTSRDCDVNGRVESVTISR